MGKDIKNSEGIRVRPQNKNLKPFKKGVSGNPKGHPKGQKNFSTIWDAFVKKIAKTNNIKPEEIDEQFLAVAFAEIKKGNYAFYKDTFDRRFGSAVKKTDLSVEGDLTISKLLDDAESE